MKKKKRIILVLFLCIELIGYGQQDPQFTQYMYNTTTVNPAYAGSRGLLSFNVLYRAQWVGLEGAPKTAHLSMNTPLGDKGVGIGLSFYNDEIGPSVENNITVDYSYTIQVGQRNVMLSFGLKGGFQMLNIDFNKLDIYNPDDIPLQTNINDRFQPIIGFGLLLHTDNWYLGLSSPNLLKTDYFNDAILSVGSERIHSYLMGGYVFDLQNEWEFKPAFLMRSVVGAPLSVDVSANFWYQKKVSVGVNYRWNASVSSLIGFQVNDQFMIGYNYDLDTTELSRYSNGSHELFLRWELFTKVRASACPRFF